MKWVWQRTNIKVWITLFPYLFVSSLFEWDVLHAHSFHTGKQKSSAEPLTKHFPIYLVGRFIDAQLRQHFGKLPVSDIPSRHLALNQLFCLIFSKRVRLDFTRFTRQFSGSTLQVFER